MKSKAKDSDSEISLQCGDAIELSLVIEKEGLAFYEKAARKAQNPEVKAMFQKLANEEKEHIQSLKAKARFLKPALVKKSASRKNLDDFIQQKLKGKVFPEWNEENSSQWQDDLKALDLGIQSEMRSIEVLSALLQSERKLDVRAIFSHLKAEEEKHLSGLQSLRKSYLSQAGPDPIQQKA